MADPAALQKEINDKLESLEGFFQMVRSGPAVSAAAVSNSGTRMADHVVDTALNFQRRGIEVASSPGIQDERVAREEDRLIRRECGRATSAAADLKRLCIKNASIFETAAGALEAITEALRNQDQINRDAWDNIKRGDVINGVVQWGKETWNNVKKTWRKLRSIFGF